MRLVEHFIAFIATSLINSIIQSTNVRFYLWHDIKNLNNCNFGVKTSRFSLILRSFIMDVITFPKNL